MSASDVVLLIAGALVALAIGSFTCVIIDRLPVELDEPNEYGDSWDTRPWGEVLGGSSRCSECGAPVRASDNIPVISYLLLRGRCRACGTRIAAYHPVVEALTPLLFLGALWSIGWGWRILPALWLIPVGLAVSVIDLRTLIMPTRIVWPSVALAVALSALAAGFEGEWAWLLTAVVGMLGLAGPLFVLWFIVPKGMGFGDVRLAVLLGWTIGFYAGTRPIAGLMLSIMCLGLSAIVGLVMGLAVMGARGRKAKVPFGPSLVIGAFFCIAFAEPILDAFKVYKLH